MRVFELFSGNGENHGKFRGIDFRDAVLNFKCSIADPGHRYGIDINELTYFGNKFYGHEVDE